jgi:hypothetical protein
MFFLNDVDSDDHPDVLVSFNTSELAELIAISTPEDGDPVMVIEMGEENFLVVELTTAELTDLDLDGLINGLGDLNQNSTVVAQRDPGIFSTAPNPFNPMTKISFYVPEAGQVDLAVYDISGRMIKRLVSESVSAGEHSVTWTGTDDRGSRVASGVYFFRMLSGRTVDTKRVVMVK